MVELAISGFMVSGFNFICIIAMVDLFSLLNVNDIYIGSRTGCSYTRVRYR